MKHCLTCAWWREEGEDIHGQRHCTNPKNHSDDIDGAKVDVTGREWGCKHHDFRFKFQNPEKLI